VRLLLDTHILVWSAARQDKVPAKARQLIEDLSNELFFSVVSLWELTIEQGLKRSNLKIDVRRLRDALLANSYVEVAVTAEHVFALRKLPLLHGDPFDRLLLAQSIAEDFTLLTADRDLANYDGPVIRV